MCTGMIFCSTFRNPTVEAWSEGRDHHLPKFGDNAQRHTATQKRKEKLRKLLRTGNILQLRRYPEWWTTIELLDLDDNTNISTVGRDLRMSIRRPKSQAGPRAMKKYIHYRRRWIERGARNHFMRFILGQVGACDRKFVGADEAVA